jgi:hypothetical protein
VLPGTHAEVNPCLIMAWAQKERPTSVNSAASGSTAGSCFVEIMLFEASLLPPIYWYVHWLYFAQLLRTNCRISVARCGLG